MATSPATIDHILDILSALPLTVRKMFGEYALYLDDKVVAFVCDDTLFIKPTPGALVLLPDTERAPPIRAARTTSSGPKCWMTPICAAGRCAQWPPMPRRPSQRNQKSQRGNDGLDQ